MKRFLSRKVNSALTLSGVLAFGWMVASSVYPLPLPLPNLPRLSLFQTEKKPQAIFVLGGSPLREKFAAQFARQHPDLPIYVSSGSPKEYAMYVFERYGIASDRIHLDYRAVDTVTNFTTMVDEFSRHNLTDIYILTSAEHMPRAQLVGNLVLGSRGIQIHPIAIPSDMEEESALKSVRDGARSLVWLMTGTAFTKEGQDTQTGAIPQNTAN